MRELISLLKQLRATIYPRGQRGADREKEEESKKKDEEEEESKKKDEELIKKCKHHAVFMYNIVRLQLINCTKNKKTF